MAAGRRVATAGAGSKEGWLVIGRLVVRLASTRTLQGLALAPMAEAGGLGWLSRAMAFRS